MGGCGWPFPSPRHRCHHPRLVQTAGKGDTPWQQLSVLELRALLRDGAIDRTSLPAQLRRAPHMPSRPEIRLPASGFLTRMLEPSSELAPWQPGPRQDMAASGPER
jgi:hypothetical protein